MAGAGKQGHVFELVGGRLCLDFVNTLEGSRETGETEEKLLSYGDLAAWGRQAGVLTEREARALLKGAARAPAGAARALERARSLREAIYGIFYAVARGGRAPSKGDLAVLNAELSEALAQQRVVRAGDRFAWDWIADDEALGRVIWPVARSAAELLTSGEVGRTRVCEAGDCSWLFVDLSKNRSRRWCDMKFCGNRAKSRRHYERKRATAAR
ncbi:MAG TPA: ABATE domain-containing protein [Pyrinomonadaceae bacterium]|nr:ABATE domain-containing protein [Pyrinomonadaceae bacterium]